MKPITHAELEALVADARPHLQGAALRRVYQSGDRAWVLELRQPGRNVLLLWSAAQCGARVHLIEGRGAQPPRPSPFTMAMRRWLEGMIVDDLELAPHDRVVALYGRAVPPDWEPASDEPGRAPRHPARLILELIPNATRTIVVADGAIVAVEGPPDSRRALRAGEPYAPPAAPAPGATDRGAPRFALAPGETLSARAAAAFEAELGAAHLREARSAARAGFRRARKRARRLVSNLESDLERAQAADGARRSAELLQSAYGTLEGRGHDHVRVPDYWQPGAPEVPIDLDSSLTLDENIQALFRSYRRYHDAIPSIEERLLGAMEKLERIDALTAQCAALEDAGSIEALRELAEREGSWQAAQRRPTARARRTERAPYRLFRSGRGAAILVGRGAKENDALSTKIARGRDVWLHARDWAGSHVILRVERGAEVHQADLLDAATLAAHFSKGARDGVVDVTHARAKFVRKPKGYPAGAVTVAQGATLPVRVEPERLARLLAGREDT